MPMLSELQGMPVVCGKRRIGRVILAELDGDLRALKGLWIGSGARGTRFLSAEHIQLIGERTVQADEAGRRSRLKAEPLFLRALSTDGRRLGAVTGALLDPLTLSVSALELSAGVWDDLLHSRRRLTRYKVDPRIRAVIVDPESAWEEVTEHEGRHDEGPDHRHGAGRRRGDDLRRDELADRAPVEPEGQADRQLDRRQSGGPDEEAVTLQNS